MKTHNIYKTFNLATILVVSFLQLKAYALGQMTEGLSVIEGSMVHVLCGSEASVNVMDKSLNHTAFTAANLEIVKPVQSFGQGSQEDKQEKLVDGAKLSYIRVQFPNRSAHGEGWVPEALVRLQSQCAGAATATAKVAQNTSETATASSAWTFPTLSRPSDSYLTGQRRFGAGRSGGRVHAACDLYRTKGEDALAASSGAVIRDKYYFYQGTYALEVRHSDGRVVRYGEITGRNAPSIASGRTVQAGQTVGYIGKVNSDCCTPMLHFEMYRGTSKGSLTQGGNSYQRRSDLMDPTKSLENFERQKFGSNW